MKKFDGVSILGVDINVTNYEEVIDYINKNINNLKGKYICVSNVHTTVMSYENKDYLTVQNSAILRLPDGNPLSSFQRKHGFPKATRVTGPDLMRIMFEESNSNIKHYFYGSTEDTLKKLEDNLNKKYNRLLIKGFFSPPFRKLSEDEDNEIIEMINKSGANIIWVGLGAPKQEKWMYDHRNKINALMIGVGAGFDYHAENIKRAPNWMQKCSLEWLYRLFQNPRKLFKRYFITNIKYLWHVYVRGNK